MLSICNKTLLNTVAIFIEKLSNFYNTMKMIRNWPTLNNNPCYILKSVPHYYIVVYILPLVTVSESTNTFLNLETLINFKGLL